MESNCSTNANADQTSTSQQIGESTDRAIVEVLPYDPSWPITFEEEAKKIKDALGSPVIIAIHHIGSTSVPGLAAKPIIDMIPVVRDILDLDLLGVQSDLASLGYQSRGELGIPFRRYFVKNDSTGKHRLFHLHVFQEGSPEIEHHIKFRDYLRNSIGTTSNDDDSGNNSEGDLVSKYTLLKLDLARKFPNDMRNYSLGKSEFISSILNKLDLKGVIFRNCHTVEEWTGYKKLMENEEPIMEEGYYQFVLLKKFQVVAAAQIKFTRHTYKILRIKVDTWKWKGEGEGFYEKMKEMVDEWVRHRRYIPAEYDYMFNCTWFPI